MNANKIPQCEVSHHPQEAFSGFPYLITRIAPSFYHINLLPLDERYDFNRLRGISRRQADANRLRACFVLDHDKGLFLEPDGLEKGSSEIPRGGHIEHGKLVLCEPIPETDDLVLRGEALKLFASHGGSKGGATLFLGDLTKGGRYPTEEERRRLCGRQENGVPVGLELCYACGEWHGECFDTFHADLLVKVTCICRNNTRCAGCRRPFGSRKLDSNYYSEVDHQIWHAPAFAALTHHCRNVPQEKHIGPRLEVIGCNAAMAEQ
jgi:hypothetical protein